MPRKRAEATVDVETMPTQENIESTESPKPKKTRVRSPKKEAIVATDAARSRVKTIAFLDGQLACPVTLLDSLVCQVDSSPFGELGAFSMSRAKDEDGKDIIEHWVVGNSARFQGKEYIAMTDDPNHKIKYFPILALGAIASLPNLLELSSGSSEKNRTLNLRLTTLSLAPPLQLQQAIKEVRWIQVDGIKYKLSFGKSGFTGLPEGYGAALYGQQNLHKLEHPIFYTFDIGYGTATLTEYSNLGKLPKRGMCSPNGGGGIATLIREFSEATSQKDSSKLIKPSQLRQVLESARWEDGKAIAQAPDGSDIGNVLEVAIKAWMKDSPLAYALENLAVIGRKHPVIGCGGGFAILPIRELVQTELTRAGVPAKNLLIPDDPGVVSLAELKALYLSEQKEEQSSAEQQQAP